MQKAETISKIFIICKSTLADIFLNNAGKSVEKCKKLNKSCKKAFMGHLGRATFSVYLIFVPDQPGKKQMYHQIKLKDYCPNIYTLVIEQ